MDEPDGPLICGKCKQLWEPRHVCDPEDLPPPPKETLQ